MPFDGGRGGPLDGHAHREVTGWMGGSSTPMTQRSMEQRGARQSHCVCLLCSSSPLPQPVIAGLEPAIHAVAVPKTQPLDGLIPLSILRSSPPPGPAFGWPEDRLRRGPRSDNRGRRTGNSGFPEFTNEVQHLFEGVLRCIGGTDSCLWKSGADLPVFKAKGGRSGRSRQLWIARHRRLLAN